MTITYKEAIEVMNRIMGYFRKKGVHLIPVGSIARRQREVGDLDFITHNKKLGHNYYKSTILYNGKEISYDIWYIPKKFGNLPYFIRSYPKYYIITIRKGLHENGYFLSDRQLFNSRTDEEIPYTNFKNIVKLAGIRYHPLSYYYEL